MALATSNTVAVVTPTFNEVDNLIPFVDALKSAVPDAFLFIVDDASEDGTNELADRLAAADQRVVVIHRARKQGLGTAYVAGFRAALSGGHAFIVEMDADGSHQACYLPTLLAAARAGADVVLGSRFVRGGESLGRSAGRRLLTSFACSVSRWLLGVPVRDLTGGYKVFSRRALEQVGLGAIQSAGFAFQIETTYLAWLSGLRIAEIPIVFVERRFGRSKLSRASCWEAARTLLRLRTLSTGRPLAATREGEG